MTDYTPANIHRARVIEKHLNDLIGYDNKYSIRIRELMKNLENLSAARLFHRGALLKVETKRTFIKLFGRTTETEFELTPETIRELVDIYTKKLELVCDDAEQIYAKIS